MARRSVRRRFVGFLNGARLRDRREMRTAQSGGHFSWRLQRCLSASLDSWWRSISGPPPLPAAVVFRSMNPTTRCEAAPLFSFHTKPILFNRALRSADMSFLCLRCVETQYPSL
jgi:hypothetical protein